MGLAKVFAVLGLLIFGCLNSLCMKILMSTYGVGMNGETKLFKKPIFVVLAMFFGMALVLPVHYLQEWRNRKKVVLSSMDASPQMKSHQTPLVGEPKAQLSTMRSFMYVGIPAAFDLGTSMLTFFGLMYLSTSIWQMLRGSMIVFSALLSVPVLGRKLYCFHWLGICICIAGLVTVGTSNVLNSDTDEATNTDVGDATLGMMLVVSGQMVIAGQMIAEEKLLKDVNLPGMLIVAFEGVWGFFLTICIVYPICTYIGLEDMYDTYAMMLDSAELQTIATILVFSCATYNCAGMAVTSLLSAVQRSMIEATRTALIWLVDLYVFYFISKSSLFAEKLMPYSWLQLLGFVFLLVGQFTYSSVLKIPGLFYPEEEVSPEFAVYAEWESPAQMRNMFSPVGRADPVYMGYRVTPTDKPGTMQMPPSASSPTGTGFSAMYQ